MQIDNKLIDKLARLSSLYIDETKKEKLKDDLADILDFVQNIDNINLDGISATSSILKGHTLLRDDKINSDEILAKDIMSNAPTCEDNYFIVPKIIE